MQNARDKIGTALVAVGLFLSVAAAGLTSYNILDDQRADIMAQHSLEQLKEAVASVPASPLNPDEIEQTPFLDDETGLSEDDGTADPIPEMPTVEVNGNLYIGTIVIPSLKLELPVMDTWDYTKMRIAPCRYVGSAYLGDLIICGHNYNSHFGRLKNLVPGDEVIFTDAVGNVFHYQVDNNEIVNGTAVQEMKSGDWDLTLFTCAKPARTTRVTVRCKLIGIEEANR